MSTEPVVQIEHLSYVYPDGNAALHDLSLSVAEGEKVAIVGANGAGKSTLLLHLNGILQSNGAVRVGGLAVLKRNLKSIRQQVGLVFQNPDDQLFCPSVFDDVAFGARNLDLPEDEVRRRVERSLASVGLAGFGERSAFHMSMGEKRRAAIATVLAMDARLIALDEPTSNLDPRGRREIIALLRDLGRTQLLVTHDLDMVRDLATRVVVLARGRTVADGAPGAVLSDRALLESSGLL